MRLDRILGSAVFVRAAILAAKCSIGLQEMKMLRIKAAWTGVVLRISDKLVNDSAAFGRDKFVTVGKVLPVVCLSEFYGEIVIFLLKLEHFLAQVSKVILGFANHIECGENLCSNFSIDLKVKRRPEKVFRRPERLNDGRYGCNVHRYLPTHETSNSTEDKKSHPIGHGATSFLGATSLCPIVHRHMGATTGNACPCL